MNGLQREQAENELEQLNVAIKAAEKWAEGYSKDPESHAKIIKAEARLERVIRKLFREKSEIISQYVDWNAYNGQLKAAATAEVYVDGDFFDGLDSDFLTVTFDTVAFAVAAGAQAGEVIYKRPLGIIPSDAEIQDITLTKLAALVGKKVDKNGAIVDNPRAAYRISDKTRLDIAKSIQTSITLGEDKAMAIDRLTKVVKNVDRAAVIAQTETVNAYSLGMLEFASQTGATGKLWSDVGATDECQTYSDLGIVAIDYLYGGELDGPAAHVGCRCDISLAYENEFPKK